MGAKASDKTEAKAEANSVWCREEYVSEKDCLEWVADQLARRAARKADEEKRRAACKAEEQKRHKDKLHGDDANVASSDHRDGNANGAAPETLLVALSDDDTSDNAGEKASDKTDAKAEAKHSKLSEQPEQPEQPQQPEQPEQADWQKYVPVQYRKEAENHDNHRANGGASSDHRGGDASGAAPGTLLIALPDDDTSDNAGEKASDKTEAKAEASSVWCREEYVSEKDCQEWVADQLARRAARKADEEKRRAARKAEEQKRHEDKLHGDDA